MQMDPEESGAASLAAVLAYYGRWIALAQARIDCGVSRDGSKAGNILRAAQKHGLDAALCTGGVAELRECAYPCIVKWKDGKFAVLRGFKGNLVCLNDPERGDTRLEAGEFERVYENEYITAAPNAGFVPEGRETSMLSYAGKRLKGAWSELLFIMLSPSPWPWRASCSRRFRAC